MAKKIRFKRTLEKVVVPRLAPLGYELLEFPDFPQKGIVGIYFFRKHLFEDVNGFVGFQRMGWARSSTGPLPWPRVFDVQMWRDVGEMPRPLGQGGPFYLYQPLAWLLWHVLNVKILGDPYFEWEYLTPEELEVQLKDAVDKLVQYGIPWLEDPESRMCLSAEK